MTTDQIIQALLAGAVGLLAAAIKFSAGSIVKRLEMLEKTVSISTEKLIKLGMSDESTKEKVKNLEDWIEEIASKLSYLIANESKSIEKLKSLEEWFEELSKRQHETNKIVTVMKLVQERCRTCSPKD